MQVGGRKPTIRRISTGHLLSWQKTEDWTPISLTSSWKESPEFYNLRNVLWEVTASKNISLKKKFFTLFCSGVTLLWLLKFLLNSALFSSVQKRAGLPDYEIGVQFHWMLPKGALCPLAYGIYCQFKSGHLTCPVCRWLQTPECALTATWFGAVAEDEDCVQFTTVSQELSAQKRAHAQ